MNWDQIEGKWKEVQGGVKERWGKITDDELMVISKFEESFDDARV